MIYLDNASTTKPCVEAREAFDFAAQNFFNPSSIYIPAIKVAGKINAVRQTILKKMFLNSSHNVVFTSGATEANNLALFQSTRFKGRAVLVSNGEHSSVFNYAKNIDGIKFVPIKLLENGEVDLADLKILLEKEDVCFVSTMLVNNETGAINKLQEIVNIVKGKSHEILIHVDAVQGFCKLNVNFPNAVDFYTISSHKINGFKGTGALIYKNTLNIKPLIAGGGQEFSLRSGTENVGGILALGAALEHKRNFGMVKQLNSFAREVLIKNVPDIKINGDGSPYILSLSILGARSEVVLRMLGDEEIYVSSGSACNSKKADNRVLSSMGVKKAFIEGTIRISFCEENTTEEVETFATVLMQIIKGLRNL